MPWMNSYKIHLRLLSKWNSIPICHFLIHKYSSYSQNSSKKLPFLHSGLCLRTYTLGSSQAQLPIITFYLLVYLEGTKQQLYVTAILKNCSDWQFYTTPLIHVYMQPSSIVSF